MIDITCPNPECRRVYHAEPSQVGRTIRCTNPQCTCLIPIVDGSAAKIVEQRSTIPTTHFRPEPRSSAARRVRSAAARYVVVASFVIGLAVASLIYSLYSSHLSSSASQQQVSRQRQSGHSDVVDEGPSEEETPRHTSDPLVVLGEADLPTTTRRSRSLKVPTQENETLKTRPSFPNGARITPDIGVDGHGELIVNNGTGEDAEIILYNPQKDEQTRDVIVKAQRVLTLLSIPVGTYELKYSLGRSYHQFERTLDYAEQTKEEEQTVRVKYSEIRVTLHPVVGGNVRTIAISRADFLKGHPAAHPLKAQR